MRNLTWIPFGLLVGFLYGYGVPVGLDLVPLLAVAFLAVGYYLVANSEILEN